MTCEQMELRDQVMAQVESNAGPVFRDRARSFILGHLTSYRERSGEEITDACKAAGIIPHDDRAFGPCFMALAREGKIIKTGHCERRKGHGTSGGNVWRLA